MPSISVEQFVQSLKQSGLIPAAEIKAFLDGLPPTNRPSDGDTFVHFTSAWLTDGKDAD